MLLFTWSFALAGRGPDVSCRNLVGAARPHTPGRGVSPPGAWDFGGCAPPSPAVHFWTPKSEPKNRQNQGFGFLCLNRSLSNLEHLCTELGFCHLIYSGAIDDASASGPVKGKDVSFGTGRSILLTTHPREYPKDNKTSRGPAGDSKGGLAPPFVSSWGWGS